MAKTSVRRSSRASDTDEPVEKGGGQTADQLTVIRAIRQYRDEADWAKTSRLAKNQENRDVFLGRQDWSHKVAGQSREFLPKVGVAVEQMTAFIKRGLIQYGDWFSFDIDQSLERVVSGQQLAAWFKPFLDNLWAPNDRSAHFSTVMSDGVKNGMLESLMIFKVHGGITNRRNFGVEPGDVNLLDTGAVEQGQPRITTETIREWRLRVDLVRPEDYYPDPTGAGLYEIHTVERDLHEVLAVAEDGIYDQTVVKMLVDENFTRPDDEERSDKDRDQDEATSPGFRKRVVIDEFWGTLLKADGTVAHSNCVAAVANGTYLIRSPEPNPFWHGESPFVAAPLVRVPWSVWHKALYDSASQLNLAINEMFNLILDGGLAAVWGIKQVRLDDLEDPGQVAGGIAQGTTLAVKQTLPHGMKVLEQITEGDVPSDAMAVFEFLNREFNQSALTNEIRLGSLPAKQVRATEVAEASQSNAVTLDGLVADLECEIMEAIVRKGFLTTLQNADNIAPESIMRQLDSRIALLITRASPAERFALFAGHVRPKVRGLSSTMARARDFQKIMAMMQAVMANPLLFQTFMRKFSPERVLKTLMKALSINPQDMEKSDEEMARLGEDLAELPGIMELIGGKPGAQGGRGGRGGAGLSAESVGEPGLAAQTNQEQNPITGMPPTS